jgi:hypothetical protein
LEDDTMGAPRAPRLISDFKEIHGSVNFPAAWKQVPAATRATLLRDWMGLLDDELHATYQELPNDGGGG